MEKVFNFWSGFAIKTSCFVAICLFCIGKTFAGGFVVGTLINTPKGLVPIESISPGQKVLSCEDKKCIEGTVDELFAREENALKIVFRQGENKFSLVVAQDQQFYCNGMWQKANELMTGSLIATSDSGDTIEVLEVEELGRQSLFSFSVNEFHNFYAQSILVHNMDSEVEHHTSNGVRVFSGPRGSLFRDFYNSSTLLKYSAIYTLPFFLVAPNVSFLVGSSMMIGGLAGQGAAIILGQSKRPVRKKS